MNNTKYLFSILKYIFISRCNSLCFPNILLVLSQDFSLQLMLCIKFSVKNSKTEFDMFSLLWFQFIWSSFHIYGVHGKVTHTITEQVCLSFCDRFVNIKHQRIKIEANMNVRWFICEISRAEFTDGTWFLKFRLLLSLNLTQRHIFSHQWNQLQICLLILALLNKTLSNLPKKWRGNVMAFNQFLYYLCLQWYPCSHIHVASCWSLK